MDSYKEDHTKRYMIGKCIRRHIKRLTLAVNVLMFVLYGTAGTCFLAEWLQSRPDEETREYIRCIKAGVDPYEDAVKEVLERYLLTGQEIVIYRTEYSAYDSSWGVDDYKIRETYDCKLRQDGEDWFSFSAKVAEAEDVSEYAQDVTAIYGSKCVVVTDFVQQLLCAFLLECNETYRSEHGVYAFSMREYEEYQDAGWPLYDGLALNNFYSLDREGLEWLFREAYRRMYIWQQYTGAEVRTEIWVSKHFRPERYGTDYPEHLLIFSEPYGRGQQEIFAEMSADIIEQTDRKSSYEKRTWLFDIRI